MYPNFLPVGGLSHYIDSPRIFQYLHLNSGIVFPRLFPDPGSLFPVPKCYRYHYASHFALSLSKLCSRAFVWRKAVALCGITANALMYFSFE